MQLSTNLAFIEAWGQVRRVGTAAMLVVVILVALGLGALDEALARWITPILPEAAAFSLMAALLILLVGLSSAALTAAARHGMLQTDQSVDLLDEPVHDDDRICALRRAAWLAGWPLLILSASLAALAAAASWQALRLPLRVTFDDAGTMVFGTISLLICFPLVVVERHLAAANPAALPEAEHVARLLRVLIAGLLCLGIGRLGLRAGFGWAISAPRAFALLTLAVACELVLRSAAALFMPMPVPIVPTGGASAVAGLLRLRPPAPAGVRSAIQNTLGIDVSQSWALLFLWRALPASAAALCLGAWLLTGLVALRMDERAVYERFGNPVRVLGPGLHLVPPWPAGRLRHVELGVVHDLALGGVGGVDPATLGLGPMIEPSADRLWDQPHPGETTYLIASESSDRQTFQVVDIDMRVLWAVGPADEDALNFVYTAEDPEAVIRGSAGRLLASAFAGRTLPAVLVEDRGAFTQEFRASLQQACDVLRTGIHVAAVSIEAIHPPAGAASAYHAVQAEAIRAKVAVARARGEAIEEKAQSGSDAKAAGDAARVAGAEIVAAAKSENLLFEADRTAWSEAGSAFLLERRLEQIAKALLYAASFRSSPELFALLRSLDVLNLVVGDNARLILRTDAAPFRAFVEKPSDPTPSPQPPAASAPRADLPSEARP